MPNPLNIIISDLKPNTLYEFDVYAIDAFGNESKHSLSTMGKTSDEIPTITLSQDTLSGTEEKLEVTVKNIRKPVAEDRKSTRLNSSHVAISYAVFCLKKKKD